MMVRLDLMLPYRGCHHPVPSVVLTARLTSPDDLGSKHYDGRRRACKPSHRESHSATHRTFAVPALSEKGDTAQRGGEHISKHAVNRQACYRRRGGLGRTDSATAREGLVGDRLLSRARDSGVPKSTSGYAHLNGSNVTAPVLPVRSRASERRALCVYTASRRRPELFDAPARISPHVNRTPSRSTSSAAA